MNQNIIIYKVTDATLSVDGENYPVGSFRLYLPENGIPSVTIGFDANSIGTRANNSVKYASVSEYFRVYHSAQNLCDNRKIADFSFVVTPAAGNGSAQTITLKNWICSVSAFDRFSASGGIVFGLTLKHPAYKLYRSASNLTNLTISQLSSITADKEGFNPVDALIRDMRAYAKDSNPTAPALKEMHTAYIDIISVAEKVLDWKGFDWPVPVGSDLQPSMRDAVRAYVVNVLSSSNPFRAIVDNLLPDWFLTAKATYGDKLKISPFNPWAAPKYSINVNTLSDFNFPPDESDPVSGVYISGSWLDTVARGCFSTPEKPEEQTDAVATFDPNVGVGSIQRYDLPVWAKHAIIHASSPSTLDGEKHTDAGAAGYGDTIPPADVTQEQFKNYNEFINKICRALYITKYKSTTSIAIAAPLMVSHAGELLLPGEVCAIIDETGKEGLRFYVTDVVISADMAGQQARTELQGRFVRTPEAQCLQSVIQPTGLYN